MRILTVCTGNVCRSPAAEYLLADAFADDPAVVVTSAGTGAPEGMPVSPVVGELLRERGIDASPHQARYLTPAIVASADLILTATRQHRSAVVSLAPLALRRTFTLRELPRLIAVAGPAALDPAPTPSARLAALLPAALRRRGGATPADDDIEDPIGRDRAFNAAVLAQIADAVAQLSAQAHGR
ncbi:hypothetical protein [Propioniciclava sp.]|uniref:arsenate reductase/protein-tyrosine-phosphatase family protein n=1 Tax=Propioniciclava sp. TaxID=2038686 RepID=UPI002616D6F3|nr:hypothetical protein [Propioniciclava sp.]